MNHPGQGQLFDRPTGLPEGLVYQPEFITEEEERRLLEEILRLPLEEASYRQWTARRRIVSYGGRYDFSHNKLNPAEPVPEFLRPLRMRIAGWAGLPDADFCCATIAEYRPGTPLGWHRDVPDFECVVGVSLAGSARLRLRRYPPKGSARASASLDLQPRSAYIIRDVARWEWQHAISPVKQLRYSITFRTISGR